jgi:hypothetical protein
MSIGKVLWLHRGAVADGLVRLVFVRSVDDPDGSSQNTERDFLRYVRRSVKVNAT